MAIRQFASTKVQYEESTITNKRLLANLVFYFQVSLAPVTNLTAKHFPVETSNLLWPRDTLHTQENVSSLTECGAICGLRTSSNEICHFFVFREVEKKCIIGEVNSQAMNMPTEEGFDIVYYTEGEINIKYSVRRQNML